MTKAPTPTEKLNTKKRKATYDTGQIYCRIFKAIRPFVKTTQKLHKQNTNNTPKLKH